MDVPGHIVYGRDLGKTAILCPRQVCNVPHSGFDEEDFFATLESVRSIMGEGKKLGAVDFSSVVTSTMNSSGSLATKIFTDSIALIGMGSMGRNVSEVART